MQGNTRAVQIMTNRQEGIIWMPRRVFVLAQSRNGPTAKQREGRNKQSETRNIWNKFHVLKYLECRLNA